MYWEFSIPLDWFFSALKGVCCPRCMTVEWCGLAFWINKEYKNFKLLFEKSHISANNIGYTYITEQLLGIPPLLSSLGLFEHHCDNTTLQFL